MADVIDTEEVQKVIDGIYKGLSDRFNPGTRQLIAAGKTYLKALHGAAAASSAYVESLDRISRQAQQGQWGGSADVGTALLQLVDVYKEIHTQQMTILKAFYVDLLVPLETNLEKDAKIIQAEHKRFMQDHKTLMDSYVKAASAVKKDKKRSRGSKTGATLDKELKHLRTLEEEKMKLNAFCEQSMKTALTQERRRYGFVLERQCSLGKHWQAMYGTGSSLLQRHLEQWFEIAKSRDVLPDHLASAISQQRQRTPIEALYSNPFNDLEDPNSIAAQLRKSRSMDASVMDLAEATNPNIGTVAAHHGTMVRSAKSDFNLSVSSHSMINGGDEDQRAHLTSTAIEEEGDDGRKEIVRAIYSYLSSGDHQLSFVEGDMVCLIGEKNKGWQFGENLRTGRTGWFPLAYTEQMVGLEEAGASKMNQSPGVNGQQMTQTFRDPIGATAKPRPVTMFGDTLLYRLPGKAKPNHMRLPMGCEGLPPPPPPPPVPPLDVSPRPGPEVSPASQQHGAVGGPDMKMSSPSNSSSSTSSGIGATASGMATMTLGRNPQHHQHQVHYQQANHHQYQHQRQTGPSPLPVGAPVLPNPSGAAGNAVYGTAKVHGNASLHSSNDSGFHNESHVAPPQPPDADYSDDEAPRDNIFATVKLRKTKTNDRSAPMLPTP